MMLDGSAGRTDTSGALAACSLAPGLRRYQRSGVAEVMVALSDVRSC